MRSKKISWKIKLRRKKMLTNSVRKIINLRKKMLQRILRKFRKKEKVKR